MRATRALVSTGTDHWFLVSHVAGYHEEVTESSKYRTQVNILPSALAGSFTATSTLRVSFES